MPRHVIAAHLIIGRLEELFLPALLLSLEGVVDHVVVNDNSEDPEGPNPRALAACGFAQRGALVVDRAPFVDFAAARNRTLRLHRELGLGEWAAFVDADEVHWPIAATIARNLKQLPPHIVFVDGYTRHYFQSFRLYTSIERRMSFFRVTPSIQWQGRVHERLCGSDGKRIAVPYVYDHFGALFPMRRHAAKGRQYASLGQSGPTLDDDAVATTSAAEYFRPLWPLALRYNGPHAVAVADVRAALERSDGERFAWSERTAARIQTPWMRAANVVRRMNFEYRWRGREIDPLARKLLQS